MIQARRPARAWRPAGLVGVGLATGLVLARLLPEPIGWAALILAVVGSHWLAESTPHAPPIAGAPPAVSSTGLWLTLVVAVAADLVIRSTHVTEPAWLIAGAGLIGALANLTRSRGPVGQSGIWSTGIGYLALYAAALSLIEQVAPATALAAWIGILTFALALDQIPGEGSSGRQAIFALVAGLTVAQLALLLGFLPVQTWAEAALLFLLAYTWIGLLRQEAAGRLNGRAAREYGLLLIGSTVLIGVVGR